MLIALEFTGKIGVGTVLTMLVITASVVALFFRFNQGDPSQWRDDYMAEHTKNETLEKEAKEALERAHAAETALVEEKAKTNLTPILELVREMRGDQKKQTEILTGLVEAVHDLQRKAAA